MSDDQIVFLHACCDCTGDPEEPVEPNPFGHIRPDPEEHGPNWNPITGNRPLTDDVEPRFTGLLAMLGEVEVAPPEAPGDVLARLQELARGLPEPPRAARVEVGQAVLDWLKEAARPEGAPPEDPWRPEGWTPLGLGSLLGVPVVLREDLEPGAWRAIGHADEVIGEGTL
ncbi:hypothetical protein ACQEVF_25250 [Nonomuraea polychroma]|uniref:hypothetical protein n=1 Tax=Nonomuraea polychroma TaxID=46176 RepID=UPI003D93DC3F